jgi:hypothetical protein
MKLVKYHSYWLFNFQVSICDTTPGTVVVVKILLILGQIEVPFFFKNRVWVAETYSFLVFLKADMSPGPGPGDTREPGLFQSPLEELQFAPFSPYLCRWGNVLSPMVIQSIKDMIAQTSVYCHLHSVHPIAISAISDPR